jgi:hypothetical protein
MASVKTGFADITLDLASIQSNAQRAGRDYDRYLRDAESARLPEVVYFIRQIMEEDSARVAHCQALLRKLSCAGEGDQAPRSPAQPR